MTPAEHDARAMAAWCDGLTLCDWIRVVTAEELARRAAGEVPPSGAPRDGEVDQ